MSTRTKRCKLIVDGVRCDADGTHQLVEETGRRLKGYAYCEEHARQIVGCYRRAMGWTWTMVPLEEKLMGKRLKAAIAAARGQVARIKQLESSRAEAMVLLDQAATRLLQDEIEIEELKERIKELDPEAAQVKRLEERVGKLNIWNAKLRAKIKELENDLVRLTLSTAGVPTSETCASRS